MILAFHWLSREVPRPTLLAASAVFLTAAYCQFFGGSPRVSAVGLGVQTLLAIFLVTRWRTEG